MPSINFKRHILVTTCFRVGVALFFLAGFFALYNAFLVDKNLEVLKLSVSSIALADTVSQASYIGPIVQLQLVDELSLDSFDIESFIGLSYSSSVIESSALDRPVDDIVSVMQEVLRKKQLQRHVLLNIFDAVNGHVQNYFKKIFKIKHTTTGDQEIDAEELSRAVDFERAGKLLDAIKVYDFVIAKYPSGRQLPSVMLRLAYAEQRQGNYQRAENIYAEIIRRFPGSPASASAGVFIDRLRRYRSLRGEIDSLKAMAARTQGPEQQEIYYKLGLAQLAAFRLEEAKNSFSNAVSIIPDNQTAQNAYLRIGICENMLGNFSAGMDAFNKLASLAAEPGLKTAALYQIGEASRRQGEYEKMAKAFNEISGTGTQSSRPILLFFEGSTYIFDIRDFLQAKDVFEKLREDFPALSLVYPGTDFVVGYVVLDIPPMLPDEVADIMIRTWLDIIIPQRMLKLIDEAALRFVKRVTEGIREIVVLDEYDFGSGGYVTIDLTERRLNTYLKKWFPIGNDSRIWNVSMDFKGQKKLDVKGTIYLPNNIRIQGILQGQFSEIKMPAQPYWDIDKKGINFIHYQPSRFLILNIPMPAGIARVVLKDSIKHFNKNFPLDIEAFRLDADNIVFTGPIREDLRAEIEAAAYGLRHLGTKDADSGFVYGRRKR